MDIPTESEASVNRRQCVRFSLPGGIEAVLSDGTSTRNVVCTDQSAEGFGLICEQNVPWSVGQTLMLNNGGHWHEVQVRNIREQDGKKQVGVRRMRDCVDHGGPSAIQNVLRVLRSACGLKHASNVQILGFCSGFLLCIVVLVIVLKPEVLLRESNRMLDKLSADSETDSPAEASALVIDRNSVPPASSTMPPPPSESPVAAAATAAHERIQGVLSQKQVITWADMEGVLELSTDQSNQLLSLIRGEPDPRGTDQLDTTKIIIESGKDFAAYVKTLPEQAFAFLTDQQRLDMQALLDLISQP